MPKSEQYKTELPGIALCLLAVVFLAATPAHPGTGGLDSPPPPVRPAVSIPRIDHAPKLEDFLGMKPGNGFEDKLLKIDQFTQRDPKDGQPATMRTEAYLGYDDKNLYVIFVAFDPEPAGIRARLVRREQIYDDDNVQIMLDTFSDERRAYSFVTNPLGIQLDRLYAEGQGFDDSFDTLWHSEGKVTEQGYVVWMALPFRSLRFPTAGGRWGVVLQRIIPRVNEVDFWPYVSSRIEGRMNQGAYADGLAHISPGRNIQLIPYGVFQAFRALDLRDPNAPTFAHKSFDGSVGLDAKFVIKDRLVLDLTVNPDFSQVESDNPQTTVNQRFEVFFPEKRPFFLENSSYFNTPMELLFTRRIADPLFGARLTGKLGPYALGLLFADDQAPGRRVPDNDPLADKRAFFGVGRVARDIFKNSSVGVIYTERQFENEYNRVYGGDFRFKFAKNFIAEGMAVTSATRFQDGTYQAGPAYTLYGAYSGRKVFFDTFYGDNSVGFLTQPGFFRRPDFRRFSNFGRYRWRPEGKRLISHGPAAFQLATWDHSGLRLEESYNVNYAFEFKRQLQFGVFGNTGHERLRPSDFSELTANRDYATGHRGFFFYQSFFKQVSMDGELAWGRAINFGPSTGPPVPARSNYLTMSITVRPISPLTIDNTILHTRLRTVAGDHAIFNNHILRTKWNYQINRDFSLRFIAQYESVLSNPEFSSITSTKNINYDFLFTYLPHPGTALYVGYNSNLQNLDRSLTVTPSGELLRTRNTFMNDARGVFVKASYLLRF